MKRQKTTKADGDKRALNPKQRVALDLLAVGTSVIEAAKIVGVSRQTVSEWLHRHHGFRAALNQRRHDLWTSVSDRLRALLPKAIDALEREIDQGKAPLEAAVHVLKACAAYGSPIAVGPTDANELETIERERVHERQVADRERAFQRQLCDLRLP